MGYRRAVLWESFSVAAMAASMGWQMVVETADCSADGRVAGKAAERAALWAGETVAERGYGTAASTGRPWEQTKEFLKVSPWAESWELRM